ncbi:MAG TPA: FkbM family methyltransferase, partial [Thermodesulfobacteriaceae bacterium]|nr:FkbM family methyltransferase [Thermodesulfobacteriaceae bacterium]
MWIFCCGMIRAGSTLQYQVVAHLVEKAGLGRRAGYFTRESFSDFFHTVKTEDGWNVVKMHDYFELVRLLLAEDKARAFYSFRDIRDVAVSSMRKFGMSFEELMEKEWLNHAIATGEKWRSCSNILVSKYEDLVRNPGREFCRMARHIGIELSEEYRDHLVGEYSLERQRQRIEELNRENLVVQDEMLYDDFSQLHVDHIHKGEIGGWKNILSHREAEILSLRYRDWLCENGYAVQFNKMETTYVPHAGWFEHEPDDEVARLVREGHFEGFEQAFWWLYLRDKDIVLDVGAHWGLYSVLASRATGGCGRIYAFEPNAGTIPVLKKNIDANTTGEITVLDCACSSREGRACFNLLDSGYSSHSYLSDSRADSGNCVETVTVDSLMEREGIEKADLVKIDVEGHELEVLRGSAGSIREKRLPLLMVEFNEHNLNRSGKTTLDLYSELRDLGYHVCRFDIYSMALKPVRVAEQISYENLFACLDPEQVNGRLEGAPENRRRIALDLIEKARATDRIKELQHLETYKKKAELTEAFRVWAETAQGALETEKARCLELKSWAEKAQAAFEQERETSGQLRQRIHDLQAALEEHQSISVEMKAWANKDQGDYEDAVELNRKYLSRIRDLEKQAGRLKQNQRVLLKGLEDMERRSVDLAAGIRDTGLLALVRNRVFNRG